MNTIQDEFNELICNSIMNDQILHNQLKLNIRFSVLKKRSQHVIWNLLHSFSVLYPENPTDLQKENTKILLLKIKHYMPYCNSCSNNMLDNFVENTNLENIVNNKSELVKFLIEYHKFVNINLTKNINYNESLYTVDYIHNKYSNRLYEEYFNQRYNFSFLNIINFNEFDKSLRQELAKLSVNITKEINKLDYDVIQVKINIK
jgi:hypothetical protein